ncbi:tetratricopeptide repeat protein [Cognatilysobacter bugurensis]|uniref:Ancillary SecYEG translocon subunit/Cell division coordinator CpoB TPR domain-containing protein n=1 Tax=Cognatilysobacter bugurensis TaxID=543356 RepID=A0A918T3U3_9GAMM|nr:hypothetical protein GCM10007067_26050 [Lysobacter bugurensis]
MKHSTLRHGVLAAALAALIVPASTAFAQDTSERESKTQDAKGRAGAASQRAREKNADRGRGEQTENRAEQQYPNATRKAPDVKASAKMSPKLQKLVKQLDEDKPAEARRIADEIIADPKANAYDRGFAAQAAAQAAFDADDIAGATQYLNQAIESNGLDNNAHFGALLMLAQLQLQEDQFEQSIKTFDRFFAETNSQKPEHLVLKGNALYRLDRFPEAAAVLKQAIDASPEPRSDWLQLLMGAYIENNQVAEAARVAETVAAKNPNDKRAQMNLAAVYLQSDMFDKAASVLEKLRAAGQFNEDKDYRQLYSTYLNMEGKEKEAATVINEGLEKGVLKPEFQTYLALAQAYYFSDQPGPSIDAYKKAAPLAPDGETYLNLARALWQEDRIAEAKDAAKQAIAKGVKKPDDAKKILALPAK